MGSQYRKTSQSAHLQPLTPTLLVSPLVGEPTVFFLLKITQLLNGLLQLQPCWQ